MELERIVYALLGLFMFKEIVAVFRKDMRATMNDAIAGLGAQWDRDRDEARERQRMLYEQLVLKTEQLEDALATLAQLSKTPLRKERSRPQNAQPPPQDAGERILNGRSRADVVKSPDAYLG